MTFEEAVQTSPFSAHVPFSHKRSADDLTWHIAGNRGVFFIRF